MSKWFYVSSEEAPQSEDEVARFITDVLRLPITDGMSIIAHKLSNMDGYAVEVKP